MEEIPSRLKVLFTSADMLIRLRLDLNVINLDLGCFKMSFSKSGPGSDKRQLDFDSDTGFDDPTYKKVVHENFFGKLMSDIPVGKEELVFADYVQLD